MSDIYKKEIVLFYGNHQLKFIRHILLTYIFIYHTVIKSNTTPLRWKYCLGSLWIMNFKHLLLFSRVLKVPLAQEEIVDFRWNLPFDLSQNPIDPSLSPIPPFVSVATISYPF